MGGTHDSDSDEEEIHRRMTPYSVRTRGRFTFDSELSPARFWKKLRNYLNDRDIAAKLDEHKWQFNFTVEGELDDEEIEAGVSADSCEMRVDLLQRELTPAGNYRPIAVKFLFERGNFFLF